MFAGIPKLIGNPQVVEGFAKMGYPDWFRLLIGGLEVTGGIGLAVPTMAKAAAAGLLVIMVGAVYSCFMAGETMAPALIVGALLAVRIGFDR